MAVTITYPLQGTLHRAGGTPAFCFCSRGFSCYTAWLVCDKSCRRRSKFVKQTSARCASTLAKTNLGGDGRYLSLNRNRRCAANACLLLLETKRLRYCCILRCVFNMYCFASNYWILFSEMRTNNCYTGALARKSTATETSRLALLC